MAYNTPGVYIEEINPFPNSIVAVPTAIPVFIGYTEKAERSGKSFLHKPVKISSLLEYEEIFGKNHQPLFKMKDAGDMADENVLLIENKPMRLYLDDDDCFFLYQSMRLYFENGGGDCYILCVETYSNKPQGLKKDIAHFTGNAETPSVFNLIEAEQEISLIVLPDAPAMGATAYVLYQLALQHCNKMQNRFAIFDVLQSPEKNINKDIEEFRQGIGSNFLNYGAAYYPWLNTKLVSPASVNFTLLHSSVNLQDLLPTTAEKQIASGIKNIQPLQDVNAIQQIHQELLACSDLYRSLIKIMSSSLNLLPPAAAIAGIYCITDANRGVWKAPANISLNAVINPSLIITSQQQDSMNVDAMYGKSVNAIRQFPGKGTLIWGARTLDGNSLDWKYINVRRTVIMVEQSIKAGIGAFVFEPNDTNTWVLLRSMIENFLQGLWRQGALAGNTARDAYDVKAGLGSTMTANDVQQGILRVMVMLAISRPAEFIVINFEQQQARQ